MKNILPLLVLVFCCVGMQAQKESSVKKLDKQVVNQKLVQLQATIKKLEKTLNEAKTLMNNLQTQKDAITELNKEDMLFLQRFMEKKSQLEQMISNLMKAASETQNNIANNLKTSMPYSIILNNCRMKRRRRLPSPACGRGRRAKRGG